jgi:hypothetical protein
MSPEHGGFIPPEHPADHERDPRPYTRAARFPDERSSGRVYRRAQGAIFTADCDLSAFRFRWKDAWHVAVIGAPPSPDLDARLAALLATGEPIDLPPTLRAYLLQRRAQATLFGPWVERHAYGPGHLPGRTPGDDAEGGR